MAKPDPLRTLITKALKFADWAAGEGIHSTEPSIPAPEDFLLEYSEATNDTKWETFAERLPAQLAASGLPTLKPLVWRQRPLSGWQNGWEAEGPCGVYRIGLLNGEYYWWINTSVRDAMCFADLDDAKGFVQEEHLRRMNRFVSGKISA